MIAPSAKQFIRSRAGDCCEYCHLPQSEFPGRSFHIEHVVAQQHGGEDHDDNLALACDRCNWKKGPNLATIDFPTGEMVPLFNPRKDVWRHHFAVDNGQIVGLTAVGRSTARLLDMNDPDRVEIRRYLEMD